LLDNILSMNIAYIIKRTRNIITEPQRELINIAKEDKKPSTIFLEFLLPLLILFTVASYLGKIVFERIPLNGTDIILKNILLLTIVTGIGTYFSAIAINEILPAFHAKRNKAKSFALVTYSLTPVYIALILSGLIPKLASLFYFIGFYSVILFWISTATIADMTKERRQFFVPVSLLIIILIFLFIRLILGAIFSI